MGKNPRYATRKVSNLGQGEGCSPLCLQILQVQKLPPAWIQLWRSMGQSRQHQEGNGLDHGPARIKEKEPGNLYFQGA